MKLFYIFIFVFFNILSMHVPVSRPIYDSFCLERELKKIFGAECIEAFLCRRLYHEEVFDLIREYYIEHYKDKKEEEGTLQYLRDEFSKLSEDTRLCYDVAFFESVYIINDLMRRISYGNIYVFLNRLSDFKRYGESLLSNYYKLEQLKFLESKDLNAGHGIFTCYLRLILRGIIACAGDLGKVPFAREQLILDRTMWREPFDALLKLIEDED